MLDVWLKLIDFITSYPQWARALVMGGATVTIFTLIFAPHGPVASAKDRIKITSPKAGDKVPWSFPVTGTYETVPRDFDLWVFTTDSTTERYWPQRRVQTDAIAKSWTGQVTGIGGQPGQQRTFGVFLVGKEGKVLLDLWERAKDTQPAIEIRGLVADIQKAQEISVIVGSGKPQS